MQAAEHTKPVILELGGSDPFVVLDSADPQKAAANAAICRLNQTGQVCCGPKRLIVTEGVADEFIAALSVQIRTTVVGDPMEPQTTLGPLASVEHLEHVQSQLDDALDKGVTVLVPGGRMDGPGAFFAPAVVTDITPEMRMYSEEVFGPVVMIYRVPDADAAVALANDTKYGLGATAFADDPQEAERLPVDLTWGWSGSTGG